MLKLIFWVAAIGSVYSYFIYPLILSFLPRKRTLPAAIGDNREVPANDTRPKLSLIITAHNEAKRIRDKLENTLKVEYEPLEIIVASDASADETDEIVREYAGRGVILSRTEDRLGKENAQKDAIAKASGDIVVFSDVATSIPPDALNALVRYFDNPTVGAVSSEDVFVSRDGGVVGEGAYVKYEMWLRKLESLRGGLVGLSGSFFAVRRELCQRWDIHSPSDFNSALNCAREGYVAVSAPDVLGHYQDVADSSKEYQRKLRTVIRGLTALARHPEVLNPTKFGLFSFQVFSHKLMRWAVPWFLIVLLVTTVALADEGALYRLALVLQFLFYGTVLVAHLSPSVQKRAFARIPYFFVQVNYAIAHATIQFLRGRRMTVWSPSQR
ncbi:glycosyltransferase family 2 protein [Marinobacter salicampi]|uniref:glycosyltransferase family 2 protein n=1 Tax=Marinobacter salicampi TaxID=435907 RepID=UPI001407F504|nr:glycosyltransferase family 2 protein [Marinobacter salicampi]